MRINIANQDYWKLEFFLDGEKIEDVIEVDSDRGWVKFFELQDGHWTQVRKTGQIEIRASREAL